MPEKPGKYPPESSASSSCGSFWDDEVCVLLTWVWCCSASSGSRSCGTRADWPPASPEDKPSSGTTHRSPSLAGGSSAHTKETQSFVQNRNVGGVFVCLKVSDVKDSPWKSWPEKSLSDWRMPGCRDQSLWENQVGRIRKGSDTF